VLKEDVRSLTNRRFVSLPLISHTSFGELLLIFLDAKQYITLPNIALLTNLRFVSQASEILDAKECQQKA
jgi:hypothetical protein